MAEKDSDIEDFERWTVDRLKDFGRKRGYNVGGKRKKELVSVAYVLTLLLRKTEEQVAAMQDYESLLHIDVDGCEITIPDPLKLGSDWECEKDATSKWPPCLWVDINNYLLDHDERNLLTRLKNDYKEGKAFSYFASQNAWIKEVFYYAISDESPACLLRCECTPSQKISSTPHKLWACLGKKSGQEYSTYCTCFAG